MAEKLSKSEVQYGPGKGTERCRLCEHFIPRDRCELVAGTIGENYWCRLFTRRR